MMASKSRFSKMVDCLLFLGICWLLWLATTTSAIAECADCTWSSEKVLFRDFPSDYTFPDSQSLCLEVGVKTRIQFQINLDTHSATGPDIEECRNKGLEDPITCTWTGITGELVGTSRNWVPIGYCYLWLTQFDALVTKCGRYQFTVTADDTPACPATDSEPSWLSKTVYVKPGRPECPKNGTSTLGCGSDGGCSGGSCGKNGGAGPTPGLGSSEVSVNMSSVTILPVPPVQAIQYPLDDPGGVPSGSSCDLRKEHMEVFDVCSYGFYYRYWSRCGSCVVDGPHCRTEGNPINIEFGIDGTVISGTLNSDGSSTLTATYLDNSTSTFNLPAPSESTFTMSSGPSSLADAAGNQTTVDYGQSEQGTGYRYNSVTTSTGEQWKCYVDGTGGKLTRMVAPDGAYADFTYAPGGQWGAGRIQYAATKDSQGMTLSEVTCTYETKGRLETYTKSDTQTVYTYADPDETHPNRSTLEVVVQSAHEVGGVRERFSRTIYNYGGPTSDTTTVTRKRYLRSEDEPPGYDGSEDQVTIYVFSGGIETVNEQPTFVKTYVHTVTDAAGQTTTYDYSGDLLNSVTDPAGMTTDYSYNGARAVASITRHNDEYSCYSTEETTYESYSSVRAKTHRDVRGTYTYYQRNPDRPWLVDAIKLSDKELTDNQWKAEPPVMGYEYTTVKRYQYYTALDQEVTDGRARVDQLKTETIPNVGTTGPDHDQVTDYKYYDSALGKICASPTMVTYKDASGASRSTTTAYDIDGHVLSTTDANGKTIWYRYDPQGRQILTIYKWQGGTVGGTPEVYTQNEYSCCYLLWSRDENGNKTYYDYDDAKRVKRTWTDVQARAWPGVQIVNGEVVNGLSCPYSLVEYTYDSFGNQETVTTCSGLDPSGSPNNRVTRYTYDHINHVTKIDYPRDANHQNGIIASEEFGYDYLGRLLWKKGGPENKYTLYRYDDWGRLCGVYYNYASLPENSPTTGGDVTYVYAMTGHNDDAGSTLLAEMHDSSGTSSYTYDLQGRLRTYKPPVGLGVNDYVWYDYNSAGQKTEIKITDGANAPYDVTYDYFANGWLRGVNYGGSTIASYTYNPVGNRLLQINGNGTSTEYTYDNSDPRYFLGSITHKHGATTLATIGYPSRDDSGNPLAMIDWTGSWTYGYDANNCLTTAVPPNPVPDQPAGGPYEYDWVGNRVRPPRDPNSGSPSSANAMVYNTADQLTTWPGMHRYTYYPDGSLNEEKNADGSQVMKSYTYTSDGLLDEAGFDYTSSAVRRVLKNTWDANKNRVEFEVGVKDGQTYTPQRGCLFVYDTTAGIPAVIQKDSVYYVREPGGELLARVDGPNMSYYHFDQLGSTRLLTVYNPSADDRFGGVSDRYDYDAYGALMAHQRLAGSVDQPYQYVGQLGYYTHCQESEFELVQLGVRFYDTRIGRFVRRDPMRGATNPYFYVAGRVTRARDPLGLYGTEGDCKGLIPDLDKWVKDIVGRMKEGACADAIKNAGCKGYFDKINKGNPLDGITIKCVDKPGSDLAGSCGSSSRLILNSAGAGASTLLHELTHTCGWYYHPEGPPTDDGPFTCPYNCSQDKVWQHGNKEWESRAEYVRHSCFPDELPGFEVPLPILF